MQQKAVWTPCLCWRRVHCMYILLDLQKGVYIKLQPFDQNQANLRHLGDWQVRQLYQSSQRQAIIERERRKEEKKKRQIIPAPLVFIMAILEFLSKKKKKKLDMERLFDCGYVVTNPVRYTFCVKLISIKVTVVYIFLWNMTEDLILLPCKFMQFLGQMWLMTKEFC